MNEELLNELKEIKEELEISDYVFNSLLKRALEYKEFENQNVSEEELFQIVKVALESYDYYDKDIDTFRKNNNQLFEAGLKRVPIVDNRYYDDDDDDKSINK